MLRYLGFHQLISRLLNSLIDETNGSILREKAGRSREWELKSEIFEKAILFLIYFVVRSEENQELIVKLGEGQKSHKESFLV
jgi:inositol 1,4,5-triphosphate receptor type 3